MVKRVLKYIVVSVMTLTFTLSGTQLAQACELPSGTGLGLSCACNMSCVAQAKFNVRKSPEITYCTKTLNGAKFKIDSKQNCSSFRYKITDKKGKLVKEGDSNKNSVTLTGLEKNKTYYVKVKSCKVMAGQNIYSKWSNKTEIK